MLLITENIIEKKKWDIFIKDKDIIKLTSPKVSWFNLVLSAMWDEKCSLFFLISVIGELITGLLLKLAIASSFSGKDNNIKLDK